MSAAAAPRPALAVVMPVLDDWDSARRLVRDLDAELAGLADVSYVMVDDGSSGPIPAPASFAEGRDVHLVELAANQGHQRAIALGLVHVRRALDADMVLVMDSDGEDRPEDARRMLERWREAPRSVVCAQRAKRSEGLLFRLFYAVYRAMFQLLTGRAISFGNFSAIPAAVLDKVLYHPGIWNNLAATLLRCRTPISFIPTVRGKRYFGSSKMNFTNLVVHGLSVISVFSDIVVSRIVIFLAAILAAFSIVVTTVVYLKLFTTTFVPGYATSVILFLANMLVSSIFTGFAVIILLLNGRSSPPALPTALYDQLVRAVRRRSDALRSAAE